MSWKRCQLSDQCWAILSWTWDIKLHSRCSLWRVKRQRDSNCGVWRHTAHATLSQKIIGLEGTIQACHKMSEVFFPTVTKNTPTFYRVSIKTALPSFWKRPYDSVRLLFPLTDAIKVSPNVFWGWEKCLSALFALHLLGYSQVLHCQSCMQNQRVLPLLMGGRSTFFK